MKNIIYLIFLVIMFIIPATVSARTSLSELQAQINSLQDQFEIQQEQLSPTIQVIIEEATSVGSGFYLEDGRAFYGRPVVGLFDILGDKLEIRNFFVFDLNKIYTQLDVPPNDSELTKVTIISGDFFAQSATGLFSDSDTETYKLNRVIDQNNIIRIVDGIDSISVFTDLADGPGYGSGVFSAANTGNRMNIALSKKALDDMNHRLDSIALQYISIPSFSRLFVIGGSISTLNDVIDTSLFESQNSYGALILHVRLTTPR